MKKMLAVVLSVLMVSSMAFAKPAAESGFATMSKADSQFLFKADADVAVLDKQEMVETEGEGIWGAWAGAGAYLGWYGYDYYQTGSWGGSWSGFGGAVGAGFLLSPW